jgi:NAD(P)-dependent dehydrogenase (short-subunit alcohol dehydrogenase family)
VQFKTGSTGEVPVPLEQPVPQTILITGANRGIGLEFARQYLSRGDRVLGTCRDPKKAADLNKLAKAHHDRLLVVPMDVADENSIRSAREAIKPHAQSLDLLINNAGIYSTKLGKDRQPAEKIGELNGADALAVMRTNAVAPVLIAQAFMDLLHEAESPKIVNITSGYGSISSNDGSYPYYYAASKAALNMFMRSLAGDPGARGVTIILMSPGWVKTDMGTDAAPLKAKDSVAGMIKVIDNLTPDDNSRFLNWKGEEQPW